MSSALVLGPVLILFFIIIALVIFFAVYFLVYKKRINKQLQNQSTAHISMFSLESVGTVILIIGAIVVSIFLFFKLSELSDGLNNVKSNIKSTRHEINTLKEEIASLKDLLEEQSSALTLFEYEFGAIDNVNHTVEMHINCIPKTSGNDTTVFVSIGTYSAPLEKTSNGMYSGKIILPLFENLGDKICISTNTNGVTNSTIKTLNYCEAPFTEILPALWVYFEDNSYFHNEKFYMNVTFENEDFTAENEPAVDEKKVIKDVKLIIKINGKFEKEIVPTKQNITIDEEFSVQKGDIVEIYVEGTDSFGYIHQRLLLKKNDTTTWLGGSEDNISDLNGNVIYSYPQ